MRLCVLGYFWSANILTVILAALIFYVNMHNSSGAVRNELAYVSSKYIWMSVIVLKSTGIYTILTTIQQLCRLPTVEVNSLWEATGLLIPAIIPNIDDPSTSEMIDELDMELSQRDNTS